jgi:hypothetical protein
MIPLLPVGGIVDHRFGIMTTPGHKGVPVGIVEGMRWAADNQAYTQGFEPGVFFPWLDSMVPYRDQCLFVPLPDEVADWARTVRNFKLWRYKFSGWPCAFVAQDGQTPDTMPHPDWQWTTLFVGGSTEWKLSEAAYSVILHAQRLGKRIHIGRVNWWARYEHFAAMPGSEEWTCDGTRTRFDGTQNTIAAWADYMVRPVQARFSVPFCDCSS